MELYIVVDVCSGAPECDLHGVFDSKELAEARIAELVEERIAEEKEYDDDYDEDDYDADDLFYISMPLNVGCCRGTR